MPDRASHSFTAPVYAEYASRHPDPRSREILLCAAREAEGVAVMCAARVVDGAVYILSGPAALATYVRLSHLRAISYLCAYSAVYVSLSELMAAARGAVVRRAKSTVRPSTGLAI